MSKSSYIHHLTLWLCMTRVRDLLLYVANIFILKAHIFVFRQRACTTCIQSEAGLLSAPDATSSPCFSINGKRRWHWTPWAWIYMTYVSCPAPCAVFVHTKIHELCLMLHTSCFMPCSFVPHSCTLNTWIIPYIPCPATSRLFLVHSGLALYFLHVKCTNLYSISRVPRPVLASCFAPFPFPFTPRCTLNISYHTLPIVLCTLNLSNTRAVDVETQLEHIQLTPASKLAFHALFQLPGYPL